MEVGRDKCLPVYKEQLALRMHTHTHTQNPRSLMLILDFLGITWSDSLEDLIGKPGDVSLSKIAIHRPGHQAPESGSTLQVDGHIPGDVVRDMAQTVPRLAGYDPYANPPNYGNLTGA